MTAVGLARARQLANRDPVSLDTIQRMASYFARHEVDKQGSTWDERGKGWQAWQGWGGDEGRSWANQIMKETAMEDAVKAGSRHSTADMKLIRSARKAAQSVAQYMTELGDDGMEMDEEPKSVKAIELGAEFNTRQRMIVSAMVEVTHEAGKFDKGIGANGAHYMAPADNPFAARGMACEYCYFYQPEGQCAIVEGIIEEYAVCKLWVIPEAVLMVETAEAVAEPMMESEPAMEDMMNTIEAASGDTPIFMGASVMEAMGLIAPMKAEPLDTPLTIKVGDEVKALARRLLGAQQ
jgi:hypothetical protein